MIENSLWQAVPEFLRQFNESAVKYLSISLPVELAPVQFSSWMGDDRDGNPFVTANVTRQVLQLARWKAADLFLKDIQLLVDELSMQQCTEAFRAKYGDHPEPYRVVAKTLRAKLSATLTYYDDLLANRPPRATKEDIITTNEQLWEPL